MSQITPMQRDMLDAAIKYAVQQDIVLSDWSEFRDYLVKESRGCLEAAELDVEKLFVYESYFKHNNAKNAKNAKKQEQFRHPDTPPKSPKNELQAVVCNSAAEQSLDLEETLPFSPALDTLKTKDYRPENLSIFVQHANTWDGTGWDFCTQDDSFISTRIVQRNSLEVKEQRTELSWKFHSEKKTYRTWFIVVEDENMINDIMLGKNWDNVETRTRAGPPSQTSGPEVEQPPGINRPNDEHFPVQEEFLETSHVRAPTHVEYISEVEVRLARLNVHSILYLDALQPSHLPFRLSYPQEGLPVRRHVEDGRSDSNSSQGLHHENRPAPLPVHDPHPRSSHRNPSSYTRPPEERRPP